MSEDRDEVRELVARARSGEGEAFEALFRRHQAGIYTFIRSQVREVELAADLTQETFVRGWESLPRLRNAGAFRGWLHRIAANLVRDHAKSARARFEVAVSMVGGGEMAAGADPVEGGEGPEKAMISGEMKQQVWGALGELPAEQRAVVVMHHLEGMGMKEIAGVMGVRPGTVMSRLARAREALRKRLASYVEGSHE